jgi:hypothetical protein
MRKYRSTYRARRRNDVDWIEVGLFLAGCLLVASCLAALSTGMLIEWFVR